MRNGQYISLEPKVPSVPGVPCPGRAINDEYSPRTECICYYHAEYVHGSNHVSIPGERRSDTIKVLEDNKELTELRYVI